MNLFGIPFCAEAASEYWCGSLVGRCLLGDSTTNLEPAICPLTRMVCRLTEAEMLKETTPENLALTTFGIPCGASRALPGATECVRVAAQGIEEYTLRMRDV